MNDGGPNGLVKSIYGDKFSDWQLKHPGVPYSVPFFNQVIAEVWEDFVVKSPQSIITAAERCGYVRGYISTLVLINKF